MVAVTPLPFAFGFTTTASGTAGEAPLLAACPPRVLPNDGSTVARSGWHASAIIEALAMTRGATIRFFIRVSEVGSRLRDARVSAYGCQAWLEQAIALFRRQAYFRTVPLGL